MRLFCDERATRSASTLSPLYHKSHRTCVRAVNNFSVRLSNSRDWRVIHCWHVQHTRSCNVGFAYLYLFIKFWGVWNPFNVSGTSILRCRTLMLWHVPQSKMFFCFFPPYSGWMLWEKMLSCKVWGMRRALVRWVMQREKARRGEKITSPGFSFFFFLFFILSRLLKLELWKVFLGLYVDWRLVVLLLFIQTSGGDDLELFLLQLVMVLLGLRKLGGLGGKEMS